MDLYDDIVEDDFEDEDILKLFFPDLLEVQPIVEIVSKKRKITKVESKTSGHDKVMQDYFSKDPTTVDKRFRRRFRMSRSLFFHVMRAVTVQDTYFDQTRDAAGKMGHSSIQKVGAALHMLAFGSPGDPSDKYFGMEESTVFECTSRFCAAVIKAFGDEYLRSPNEEEVQRILQKNKERAFPGMFGSLDTMHWKWNNYTGKEKIPTVIQETSVTLEAVASYDLRIWQIFFRTPRSLTGNNILDRSDLLNDLLAGKGPRVDFLAGQGPRVNGLKTKNQHSVGYYLTDAIYPTYAVIAKVGGRICNSQQVYRRELEAARMDVERAFGKLRGRFAILAKGAKLWKADELQNIITCCIILHNMIVEMGRLNKQDISAVEEVLPVSETTNGETMSDSTTIPQGASSDFLDKEKHFKLRADLIYDLWDIEGEKIIVYPEVS